MNQLHKPLRELWAFGTKTFKEVDKETDTQWGWEIQEDTLYLKFQGSVSRLDWRQNLDFLATPYKDMKPKFKVHRGFLGKWKAIQENVQSKITKEINKVIIVGFSQGGALALLAHEDIWFNHEQLRESLETYAFGTPRVFSWLAPRDRFENVTYIQYKGDMVCGVPPWFFGYKHMSKNWITIPEGDKWPQWFRIHPIHHMEYFEYFKED